MKGRFNTFVVRILCEDQGKFKGNVLHLSTQDQIRFDKLEEMDKFILIHAKATRVSTCEPEDN
jgi:hypothetical protein